MKTGIKTDLTLPSSVETAITVILKKVFKSTRQNSQGIREGKRDNIFFFFYKGVEENTEEPENILRLFSLL